MAQLDRRSQVVLSFDGGPWLSSPARHMILFLHKKTNMLFVLGRKAHEKWLVA
jgi:hypothetical protein